MKPSKPTSSSKKKPLPSRLKQLPVGSRRQLKELQSLMAAAVFRPLTARDRMQTQWTDGSDMAALAARLIKPNDRLNSFERLEIYNRVYWFRVLDCLYDDYPGVRAIVGEKKFMELATAYLAKYPSVSFTLRNLGQRLEQFLREEPQWIRPNEELTLDMTRFEWAQVVAFDDAALPKITTDDVLDTPPAKLRLSLQPYLSLLQLDYAVDKFLLAVQKRDADVLRDEASNTFEAMPERKTGARRLRLPRRERVHLVVHRYENALFYKRLEPEAFAILEALGRGVTVEKACLEALSNTTRQDVDWPARIKEWFNDWSSLGWFCRAKKPTNSSGKCRSD
ncbi:MAG TPA: DNA-binding domain-containing protein [Chthoniobacterales bacterium]|nr:DNA-binding domain-containing protein [Chthoniobacterales bacterium]